MALRAGGAGSRSCIRPGAPTTACDRLGRLDRRMNEITITDNSGRIVAPAPAYAEIFREFPFEAPPRLPFVPADHKCSRLHGHSYRVEVRVRGEVAKESGWVIDFAD